MHHQPRGLVREGHGPRGTVREGQPRGLVREGQFWVRGTTARVSCNTSREGLSARDMVREGQSARDDREGQARGLFLYIQIGQGHPGLYAQYPLLILCAGTGWVGSAK